MSGRPLVIYVCPQTFWCCVRGGMRDCPTPHMGRGFMKKGEGTHQSKDETLGTREATRASLALVSHAAPLRRSLTLGDKGGQDRVKSNSVSHTPAHRVIPGVPSYVMRRPRHCLLWKRRWKTSKSLRQDLKLFALDRENNETLQTAETGLRHLAIDPFIFTGEQANIALGREGGGDSIRQIINFHFWTENHRFLIYSPKHLLFTYWCTWQVSVHISDFFEASPFSITHVPSLQ